MNYSCVLSTCLPIGGCAYSMTQLKQFTCSMLVASRESLSSYIAPNRKTCEESKTVSPSMLYDCRILIVSQDVLTHFMRKQDTPAMRDCLANLTYAPVVCPYAAEVVQWRRDHLDLNTSPQVLVSEARQLTRNVVLDSRTNKFTLVPFAPLTWVRL